MSNSLRQVRRTIDEPLAAMDRILNQAGGQLDRVTTRRTRIAASTVLVVMMHVLMFWGFACMRPKVMNLPQPPDDVILPVDLWQPPDVIPPVEPVLRQRQETTIEPPPQPVETVEPAATPQPVSQPVPVPVPAPIPKPVPVVTPKPAPVPVPVPVATPVPAPQPDPVIKAKPKQDEPLDSKPKVAIAVATPLQALNLHDTPLPTISVTPSGLTPDKPQQTASGSTAGGAAAAGGQAGGAAGGAANLKGLKGGRGQIQQAIENHNSCIGLQRDGKPIPPDCQMMALSGMKPMGPKADSDFQKAAASRDAYLRYKSAPGNAAYWNRIGKISNPAENNDRAPEPGAYSSDKDQRVMGGGGGTADPH